MTFDQNWFIQWLDIPSPTFQEAACFKWLGDWLRSEVPQLSESFVDGNAGIFRTPLRPNRPHIAFVGHLDVVPEHFTPRVEGDKLFAAGASDMKTAVGCFAWALKTISEKCPFNVSFILYDAEEGTPMEQNGLYRLFKIFPEAFRTIDCAIVGEPTDMTIQCGCVGSLHTQVTISGEACHSARPWQGKNALYEALPFIQTLSNFPNKKHTIMGCEFVDVMQITESHTESGRTTIPGEWTANINYRFAPSYKIEDAKRHVESVIQSAGVKPLKITHVDAAPAGDIIETPLLKAIVATLNYPLKGKQAWTDVAQFSQHRIPAFNFGPGFTGQAHKPNEYISIQNCVQFIEKMTILLGE